MVDEEGDSSYWVELFNPTAGPIDLSGWHLNDAAASPMKWPIPDGSILVPFEFKVFFASAKPVAGHGNFRPDSASRATSPPSYRDHCSAR